MQRIASPALPAVLGLLSLSLLASCAAPQTTVLRPLPDPVLRTRPARIATPVPRPLPAPRRQAPPPAARPVTPPDWYPPSGFPRGRWTSIVVHHSASDKSSPQSMHLYHLTQRGWKHGLGYHFVVGNGIGYPEGQVFVGSRWKRQLTGAHCRSRRGSFFGAWRPDNYFNEHGVGVCLIGNFEKSRPTERQLRALAELLAFLCDAGGISPNRIYGHGEVTGRTLCPGKHVNMDVIRRMARRQLAIRHGRGESWSFHQYGPGLLTSLGLLVVVCTAVPRFRGGS
jgi:hypothetical protein